MLTTSFEQSAPEQKMLERAERRAKITGRYTDPEAIKRSRLKSPECVSNLASPSHVKRVRFIDNASDEDPPCIMYDSARDPDWNEREEEAGRGKVNVKGFVEGKCVQGEDGRVRCAVEEAKAEEQREGRKRAAM